ncbi:PEP-CTERM sorting domain-containing protein [Persicirhabdus sediminis]|uniref:PEP-CTERM sorting domain-containing protein n=1 Tax=Persicirhabdus sediminis TaxID=454144 RepID=A0A8J7MGD2_9BACT|nr:PEP-CTERM sorting domain-containing protein [Persicirhabdus sediminis]MBK1792352.1 PEP-CTERM sorting domain-containing protein [Persicirhabdus sediminis]
MQTNKISLSSLAISLATFATLSMGAHAAVTLQITEYTSSAITFTVSGTLDADSEGARRSGLLIIAPSVDLGTQWYTGSLVLDTNSLTVDGVLRDPQGFDNGGETGDSIYWSGQTGDNGILTSGTVLSGSARLTGTIDDSFDISDFSLYSGLSSLKTPNRLEAVATPEPTSALLLCFGAISLLGIRRKAS